MRCIICNRPLEEATGAQEKEIMDEYIKTFSPLAIGEPKNPCCEACYQLIHPSKHPEVLKAAIAEMKKKKSN